MTRQLLPDEIAFIESLKPKKRFKPSEVKKVKKRQLLPDEIAFIESLKPNKPRYPRLHALRMKRLEAEKKANEEKNITDNNINNQVNNNSNINNHYSTNSVDNIGNDNADCQPSLSQPNSNNEQLTPNNLSHNNQESTAIINEDIDSNNQQLVSHDLNFNSLESNVLINEDINSNNLPLFSHDLNFNSLEYTVIINEDINSNNLPLVSHDFSSNNPDYTVLINDYINSNNEQLTPNNLSLNNQEKTVLIDEKINSNNEQLTPNNLSDNSQESMATIINEDINSNNLTSETESIDDDWFSEDSINQVKDTLKSIVNPLSYSYEPIPESLFIDDNGNKYYSCRKTNRIPDDWKIQAKEVYDWLISVTPQEVVKLAIDKLSNKDKEEFNIVLNLILNPEKVNKSEQISEKTLKLLACDVARVLLVNQSESNNHEINSSLNNQELEKTNQSEKENKSHNHDINSSSNNQKSEDIKQSEKENQSDNHDINSPSNNKESEKINQSHNHDINLFSNNQELEEINQSENDNQSHNYEINLPSNNQELGEIKQSENEFQSHNHDINSPLINQQSEKINQSHNHEINLPSNNQKSEEIKQSENEFQSHKNGCDDTLSTSQSHLNKSEVKEIKVKELSDYSHLNKSEVKAQSDNNRVKSDTNQIGYKLIEDNEELKEAIALLSQEKILAIDTETTGLDPHIHKIRLIQIASYNNLTILIDCFKCDPRLIQPLLINDSIKIFHNAKFDLQFFLALDLEINQSIFDTMLAHQLITAGNSNVKSSLKAIASKFLNLELNKDEQVSDWQSDKLSDSQLNYAVKDAEVLLPLREKLREAIIENRLTTVAKIEFDCVVAVAQMEFNGMLLDVGKWQGILKEATYRKEELRIELQQLLPSEKGTLFELEINLDSPKQLLEALNRAGINCKDTNSKTLKKLLPNYPEILKPLLEYKKVAKFISSFGDSLLKKINLVTGRLHGEFNQLGSEAGRFTCIAEGQKVQVLGGEKNIEDVKVGDYVYCYTDEGKLTLRKVLNVFDNGVQDVVKVNWQSIGVKGSPVGDLVCTPDHLIKTVNRGWVKAHELTCGDKIYHLRRSVTYRHGKYRQRFFGTNCLDTLEEQIIKTELFNQPNYMHCHHKNGNTLDNSLDNLEVISSSEHGRLHTTERLSNGSLIIPRVSKCSVNRRLGKDAPNWKELSKYQLLRMLAEVKGRLTYVPMDFETYKRKLKLYNIDPVKASKRYSSNGTYLSRSNIKKALLYSNTTEEASKLLGIGTRKLKNLCTDFKIIYSNHKVINVAPYGKARVYDLEIEECHNFIANEICVHNCKNPNVQQIPREKAHRECFVARPSYKLIIADYSQIELRIAAELTNDKTMISAYNNGEDLHKLTASIVLNKPLEEVSKGDRQVAKSANFGLVYGSSVNGFRGYAEGNYGISLTEKEAKKIMDNFFKSYQGLNKWHKATKARIYRQGVHETRTLSGRIRHFDKSTPQQVLNTPVQGTGADMLKLALAKLVPALKGYDCKILATVHDEIILEAKEEIADKVADILSDVMVEAGKEFLLKVPVEAEASIGDSWAEK